MAKDKAKFIRFDSFLEAVHHGKHNLKADPLKLAFTVKIPDASASALTDLKTVPHTNLSGTTVKTMISGSKDGVYRLVVANTTLSAVNGPVAPWRYPVLYNGANKLLIGWWDKSEAVKLEDGDALLMEIGEVLRNGNTPKES